MSTTESPSDDLPRRSVLRTLAGTAVVGAAAVGAGVATAGPAAAAPGNPVTIGASNAGATSITALTSSPGPNSATFAAINNNTNLPIGVYGVAGPVSGLAVPGGGVVGNSRDQHGVLAVSKTNSALLAQSTSGPAVEAYSDTGFAAVYGRGSATHGVLGASVNGAGVYGLGNSDGQNGVGGRFGGGRAQLFIEPAATTGAPTGGDHSRGELFLDNAGSLYLCKNSGTPGTWKLIG